jgi:hypothetical protein
MKKTIQFAIALMITISFIACNSQTKNNNTKSEQKTESVELEKPTDADFLAFMVYHHMNYMQTTAEQAGGTNRLFHTRELPTEGTDPVVTPALDHIYTKAVIELTDGPVTVEFPEVEKGRYYSIHITDEEHYTIYDEVFPKGKYTFVRKGKDMSVPKGAKAIECDGNYPHLFIRVQIFNKDDLVKVHPIQDNIGLNGTSKTLEFDNPIKFTLANRDAHSQNKDMLEASVNFNHDDYIRVSNYIGANAPRIGESGNFGKYGPIDSKEKGSDDMENRAGGIIGHLGFPVHHAYYQPYFTNCNDEVLNGDKTEVFVFPYEPEGVELFWSITRYSALTRNTIPNKNDLFNAYNTTPDENGNITITFSIEDPNDGTYWMPVIAGDPYYLVCRYYKPDMNNLPQKPCN